MDSRDSDSYDDSQSQDQQYNNNDEQNQDSILQKDQQQANNQQRHSQEQKQQQGNYDQQLQNQEQFQQQLFQQQQQNIENQQQIQASPENKKSINSSHQQQQQDQQSKKCQKCVQDHELLNQRLEVAEKLEQQNQKLAKDIQELKKVKEDFEKQADKKKSTKEQQQKETDLKKKNPQFEQNKSEIAKLQKEIDDMHLQLSALKSDVKKYQKVIDNDQNFEKARLLQSQQERIERDIENIKAENQNLDKERRENEYEIQLRNAEFVDQQRELKEKLKELKDEHINTRNKNRDFKIQMLVQQEYLVRLEQQHREICETFGVSSSLVQTRIDNITKLIVKNHERKLAQQDKDEAEEKKLEEKGLDEQKYLENRQKIIDLMNQKRKDMNEGDEQLKNLETQLQLSERELQLSQMKCKEKEHELNIVLQKITELKRQTKHNQLQPIILESNVHASPSLQNAMKNQIVSSNKNVLYANKHHVSKSMKHTRSMHNKIQLLPFASASNKNEQQQQYTRVVEGGCALVANKNLEILKDSDQIKNPNKDYKISELTFYYLDHVILGLQVKYKVGVKKDIQQIDSFLPQNINLKYLLSTSYQFSDMEYIQKVTGYHNNTSITFLEFVTSRSGVFTVGNEKKNSKSKFFELDIKDDEKPISFQLGIKKIEQESQDINQQQYLVKLGLECQKKNQFNIKSFVSSRNSNKINSRSFQDMEQKLTNNNISGINEKILSQQSHSREITPNNLNKIQNKKSNLDSNPFQKQDQYPSLNQKNSDNLIENQIFQKKNGDNDDRLKKEELQKFLND